MGRYGIYFFVLMALFGSAQASTLRTIPDLAHVNADEPFQGSYTRDCKTTAPQKGLISVLANVIGLSAAADKAIFTLQVGRDLFEARAINSVAQRTGTTTQDTSDDLRTFSIEFEAPLPIDSGTAILVLVGGNTVTNHPVLLQQKDPCGNGFSKVWWTQARTIGGLTFTFARALLDGLPILIFVLSFIVMCFRLPEVQSVTRSKGGERYIESANEKRFKAKLSDKVVGDVGWKLDSLAANTTVITAIVSFSSTFTLLTNPVLLKKEVYQLYLLLPPALCLLGAAMYIFSSQRVRNATQVVRTIKDNTPKITAWNYVWVYIMSNSLIIAGVGSQLGSAALLIAEFSLSGILQLPHIIVVSFVFVTLAIYASTYLMGFVYTTIWLVGEQWVAIEDQSALDDLISKNNLIPQPVPRNQLGLP